MKSNGYAELLGAILDLRNATEIGFAIMEKRFDNVDCRLENVEHRLDNVEHRLDNVEHRLDNVEHRLDSVETRVETGFGTMTLQLERFGTRLTVVEHRSP